MGDGRDVPRVTGHGTCKEGGGVVNEVGDYHLHELLWELGQWDGYVVCVSEVPPQNNPLFWPCYDTGAA